MLSGPAFTTEAESLPTLSVSGTIRNYAFGIPDITFRTFPTVNALAFAASVDPVSATQKRTDTWKRKRSCLFFSQSYNNQHKDKFIATEHESFHSRRSKRRCLNEEVMILLVFPTPMGQSFWKCPEQPFPFPPFFNPICCCIFTWHDTKTSKQFFFKVKLLPFLPCSLRLSFYTCRLDHLYHKRILDGVKMRKKDMTHFLFPASGTLSPLSKVSKSFLWNGIFLLQVSQVRSSLQDNP